MTLASTPEEKLKIFWEKFGDSEIKHDEVINATDAIKLQTRLASTGYWDSGEAHSYIRDLVRTGMICLYDYNVLEITETYKKYLEVVAQKADLDSVVDKMVANQISNHTPERKKDYLMVKIPSDLKGRFEAGLKLSDGDFYIKLDDSGKLDRFYTTKDYKAAFG